MAREDGCSPESSLGSHTQVLQNEPYSNLVIGISESKGAGAETSDKIACEHATGPRRNWLLRRRHASRGHLTSSVIGRIVGSLWIGPILVGQLSISPVIIVHLRVSDRLAVRVLCEGGISRRKILRRWRV